MGRSEQQIADAWSENPVIVLVAVALVAVVVLYFWLAPGSGPKDAQNAYAAGRACARTAPGNVATATGCLANDAQFPGHEHDYDRGVYSVTP
jgi:hypothetical protein